MGLLRAGNLPPAPGACTSPRSLRLPVRNGTVPPQHSSRQYLNATADNRDSSLVPVCLGFIQPAADCHAALDSASSTAASKVERHHGQDDKYGYQDIGPHGFGPLGCVLKGVGEIRCSQRNAFTSGSYVNRPVLRAGDIAALLPTLHGCGEAVTQGSRHRARPAKLKDNSFCWFHTPETRLKKSTCQRIISLDAVNV